MSSQWLSVINPPKTAIARDLSSVETLPSSAVAERGRTKAIAKPNQVANLAGRRDPIAGSMRFCGVASTVNQNARPNLSVPDVDAVNQIEQIIFTHGNDALGSVIENVGAAVI